MSNYEQFLKSSLSKYRHGDITKRDVLTVFTTFNDLRPKVEDFVFNDGIRKTLLQLDGTIPVVYKGSVYNIPICIWLLDTHPYNPPMVYVKPTSTMQIKSGRNVDMNGKIDLPYLREWKYPTSDLLGMIQILTIVFGEEPPVYSRTQAPQQQPVTRYPNQQTPYPSSGGTSFPMPMPSVGVGAQNTPYPTNTPYPSAGGGYPQHNPYNQGQFQGYPQQTTSSYQGYPSSYPSSTAGSNFSGGSYQQPPAYHQASTSSETSSSTGKYSGTNTVTEEHLKASLLSAVEDKMRWRLKETFAQAQAEMDVLYKTQADLVKGKDKLETMIKDLEREKTEIDGNIRLLKDKDKEVKDTLSRLDNQSQITIDDAVVTTAPLYRQLLNAFAEEQAIEDAIYYLGEALRKDVIDLDVFLKNVRELSRKQFMKRALIQKCREKAGLPPLA